MADWQPIETAPKKTLILIYLRGEIYIGSLSPWRDQSYPELWQTQWGEALVRPWKYEDGGPMPTHWMPLPTPPMSGVRG